MTTKIEWTQETWNPVTGCTPVSAGCAHCYARRMAKRLAGRFGYPADDPFRVTLHEDKLEQPLRWRKPSRVFVCSMGDLFHEDVPFEFIAQVWEVMYSCPLHTFQVLTKRPARMAEFLSQFEFSPPEMLDNGLWMHAPTERYYGGEGDWPISNIWLGVTAENRRTADERIPILLDIQAAVRFVSIEPMLEVVDLQHIHLPYDMSFDSLAKTTVCGSGDCRELVAINWVIVGGETGPGARPMHPDWARQVRDQCVEAGVPFFFKKMGTANGNSRLLDGQLWEQYPSSDNFHTGR